MRILMRVDCSPAIGMGHAMRCLALAQQLRARGARVEFACRELPASPLAPLCAAQGHAMHALPGAKADWAADAAQTLAVAGNGETPEWIVVDHYGLDARWETLLRPRCGAILVIDDLADRDHDCDLLIDQNFHDAAAERYRDRVPSDCRMLLGPRYALLRTPFSGLARPTRDGMLRRVLVSYGGTDPTGETLKALHGLRLAALPELAASVAIGPGNARAEEIRALCASIPGTQPISTVDDLSRLMVDSDIALGAGGITMWERCAMGLPSIVTAIAGNQEPSSLAMGEAGLCIYLGSATAVTPQAIADALRGLAAAPALLRHLSKAARRLVDGEGARRVADRMLGAEVSLRPAGPQDCDRVFAWRNHPSVRAGMIDPTALDLPRHKAWFAAALQNHARDLLIIENAGKPVGVLRFDNQGQAARVSVFLDPGAIGGGLGTAALEKGIAWLRERRTGVRRIEAEVLVRNEASLKTFAKGGVTPSRQILERTVA